MVKIDVLEKLERGIVSASDLMTVSEAQAFIEAETQKAIQEHGANAAPPVQPPQIIQLVQDGSDPNLVLPSGVATNGNRIFWGNEEKGKDFGSVMGASMNPGAPSTVLTKNVSSVYGMAATNDV